MAQIMLLTYIEELDSKLFTLRKQYDIYLFFFKNRSSCSTAPVLGEPMQGFKHPGGFLTHCD